MVGRVLTSRVLTSTGTSRWFNYYLEGLRRSVESTCKTGGMTPIGKAGAGACLVSSTHLHVLRAVRLWVSAFDFVSSSARTEGPHGGASYVQMGRRNRIESTAAHGWPS